VLSLSYQYISGDDTGAVGLAVSTTISLGGEVIVDSGGVASATTVGQFSKAQVNSGGTAIAMMVGYDSFIDIEAEHQRRGRSSALTARKNSSVTAAWRPVRSSVAAATRSSPG
jgi:hypothetical protein